MMIMWSEHSGENDEAGRAVVGYMLAEEWTKEVAPGVKINEKRDPPPELLRGDPALMRQAISAVPFKHRYASGVLSFHADDVDLEAWNAGDPGLRQKIAATMQAVEDVAFAGIEPEDRPPVLWSSHRHAGRLELNFVCPRAIWAGDRLRTLNPQPPGHENRKTWDALRDVLNLRNGWADPNGPDHKRAWSVPNHILKRQAAALRAGLSVDPDPREKIGRWVTERIKSRKLQSREQVIAALKSEGFEITRLGREYVTVKDPASGDRYRLRGAVFSEDFTSIKALRGDFDEQQPEGEKLAEAEARLDRHVRRRAEYNRARYGQALGYNQKAEKPSANLDEHLEWSLGPEAIVSWGGRWRGNVATSANDADPGAWGGIAGSVNDPAPQRRKGSPQDYKARLWLLIYGGILPPELLLALAFIDMASRTVRLKDGASVKDLGERITTSRATETAVALMIAEAQAKGWPAVRVQGSEKFVRLAREAACQAGLEILSQEVNYAYRHGASAFGQGRGHGSDDGGPRGAPDRGDVHFGEALRRLGAATSTVDERLRQAGRRGGESPNWMIDRAANDGLELERFKTEIDLRELAASLGYAEDRAASDRNHTVMRGGAAAAHKLIIGLSQSGHWVWSDNHGKAGTAIDLLRSLGMSLGAVRKHLRPWIGDPASRPTFDRRRYEPKPRPKPSEGNEMKARAEWENANSTGRSVFLEKSRGLAPETLASDRFAGTFRVDSHQNAVFPYLDGSGTILGIEKRNRPASGSEQSFKVYTAGAKPGIWCSAERSEDRRLVIVESPIDAMSHWQMLSPEEQAVTRYAAIRAGFADDDLASTIGRLSVGAEVVSACDPDPAGDAYSSKIRAVAELIGRPFREERPDGGDWNEVLQKVPVSGHQRYRFP